MGWTDPTLHMPRILCLHGGGSTGEIFGLQCRGIIHGLSSDFRLVFTEAPFLCPAGPGMLPVFDGMGPYKRWLRWLPEQTEIDHESALDEIEYALKRTMDEDDEAGASGDWVGLIGFSQGAKVAMSILLESQLRADAAQKAGNTKVGFGEGQTVPVGFADGRWRFAACLAGRAPIVRLSELGKDNPWLATASELTEGFNFEREQDNPHRVWLPNIHVHGLQDPGLDLHRVMVEKYVDKDSTKVIEWDADHRVPARTVDAEPVVKAIFAMAKKAGLQTTK